MMVKYYKGVINEKKALIAGTTFFLMMFTYSYAAEKKHANTLDGCYRLLHGYMEESTVNEDTVIGTYHFMLIKNDHGKGKRVMISGPIAGSEASGTHEKGEIHGGHILGTYDRLGTLSSNEDDLIVTDAKCFNEKGVPQLVTGIETLKFIKGTGIYSGLTHGSITFNFTFDACTDSTNPVADLKASYGEICF